MKRNKKLNQVEKNKGREQSNTRRSNVYLAKQPKKQEGREKHFGCAKTTGNGDLKILFKKLQRPANLEDK